MTVRHWMQITSGRGPVECCWVVARPHDKMLEDARECGVRAELLDAIPAAEKGTYKSLLFSIDAGEEPLAQFRNRWNGTILWVGASIFRPRHKRKNWYVGVHVLLPPEPAAFSEKDYRIETMRASGPGGQHVNTTASAVRITHLPTGLTTTAREERSQHQNRRLALARMALLLQSKAHAQRSETQQNLWDQHNALERGNPIRIYTGMNFVETRR